MTFKCVMDAVIDVFANLARLEERGKKKIACTVIGMRGGGRERI